ncbi:MAG: zinc ribbon domain-containing protein [Myxococcales bacterium]|nr:zinc ribbon domain-containing protein [Myxococcales bacterium]
MASAQAMVTCSSCGALVAAEGNCCPACDAPARGPAPGGSSRSLRVDPERLESALRMSGEATDPTAWARPDDSPEDASIVRLSELMMEPLPPLSEPPSQGHARPPSGVAEEPETSTGSDQDAQAQDEANEAAPKRDGEAEPADDEVDSSEEAPISIPPAHRPSGPPVLASEALKRELSPTDPGVPTMRWVTACCSLSGIGLTLWTFGPHPGIIPIAVGFLALIALAVAPMPYSGRAAALTTIAGGGVITASLMRFRTGFDPTAVGLMLVVWLLAASLHLRAWHRASDLARILVALGITAGIAWLAAKGSLSDLSSLEADWQRAAPRVLQIPFGLLLMVSLLAFMDSRTTGGCSAWAAGLWLWYGTTVGVEIVARIWHGGAVDWSLVPREPVISMMLIALLLPIAGVGAAQLLANALGRHARSSAADDGEHPTPPG